jgi:murein DD-endopeptidase MepM/ murein hydrolase activator NlpD
MRQKRPKPLFILMALLGGSVVVFAVVIALTRFEGEMPLLELDDQPVRAIGASHTLKGLASDQKTGLRRVWIAVIQNGKEKVLFDQSFPSEGFFSGGTVQSVPFSIEIKADELGLVDGEALLRTAAWDFSWRGWWAGNQTYAEHKVLIDTRPPVIEVLSRAHNINQGGSALAIYRLSESSPVHGVHVGDSFFPGYGGYSDDPNLYIVFFCLAHDQKPDVEIWISAEDDAGNRGQAGLAYHVNPKRFKSDRLVLSEGFLKRKVPELSRFLDASSQSAPLVDRFVRINDDLRRKNQEILAEACRHSDAKLYWKGPFVRLPGSARMAGFADHRSYEYDGKVIDEQFHMGIDLASKAQAPIPAANTGRVALAEFVGIYGNTVILDHGFGLFSMYGHLSRINVKPDQIISRGDIIGHTGTTGLAGGDHLHYAMMIGYTFVNPIEWWDPSWIKNNVTGKLRDVSQGVEA